MPDDVTSARSDQPGSRLRHVVDDVVDVVERIEVWCYAAGVALLAVALTDTTGASAAAFVAALVGLGIVAATRFVTSAPGIVTVGVTAIMISLAGGAAAFLAPLGAVCAFAGDEFRARRRESSPGVGGGHQTADSGGEVATALPLRTSDGDRSIAASLGAVAAATITTAVVGTIAAVQYGVVVGVGALVFTAAIVRRRRQRLTEVPLPPPSADAPPLG